MLGLRIFIEIQNCALVATLASDILRNSKVCISRVIEKKKCPAHTYIHVSIVLSYSNDVSISYHNNSISSRVMLMASIVFLRTRLAAASIGRL